MARLKFDHVGKTYGDGTVSVTDADFEIEDGEFCVLVGPSGCGKTTLLRMVAGLEDISAGAIIVDETRVNNLEPKERNVAMVFQNYALYPHLSGFDNVGFSMKLRGDKKEVIRERVVGIAASLALTNYLPKLPRNMSGGQRQRVAMGRALVRDPEILLMDEPLSNLDARLRSHMRTEIGRRHAERPITTLYVTHDQTEAMTLGQRVVVMRAGAVQQVASPTELFVHPANLFVASFIGSPSMNFVRGTLASHGDAHRVTVGRESVILPTARADRLPVLGDGELDVIVGMRPDDIHSGAADENQLTLHGTVVRQDIIGRSVHLLLDVEADDPGTSVAYNEVVRDLIDVEDDSARRPGFVSNFAMSFYGLPEVEEGSRIAGRIGGSNLYLFDPESGVSLL